MNCELHEIPGCWTCRPTRLTDGPQYYDERRGTKDWRLISSRQQARIVLGVQPEPESTTADPGHTMFRRDPLFDHRHAAPLSWVGREPHSLFHWHWRFALARRYTWAFEPGATETQEIASPEKWWPDAPARSYYPSISKEHTDLNSRIRGRLWDLAYPKDVPRPVTVPSEVPHMLAMDVQAEIERMYLHSDTELTFNVWRHMPHSLGSRWTHQDIAEEVTLLGRPDDEAEPELVSGTTSTLDSAPQALSPDI